MDKGKPNGCYIYCEVCKVSAGYDDDPSYSAIYTGKRVYLCKECDETHEIRVAVKLQS